MLLLAVLVGCTGLSPVTPREADGPVLVLRNPTRMPLVVTLAGEPLGKVAPGKTFRRRLPPEATGDVEIRHRDTSLGRGALPPGGQLGPMFEVMFCGQGWVNFVRSGAVPEDHDLEVHLTGPEASEVAVPTEDPVAVVAGFYNAHIHSTTGEPPQPVPTPEEPFLVQVPGCQVCNYLVSEVAVSYNDKTGACDFPVIEPGETITDLRFEAAL